MVPKFSKEGTSFKGLVQYLTHDAGHKQTSERVAWTHTLNLCDDHVESAIPEMFVTAGAAPFLKEAAGIRNSQSVDNPVKSVSLNWHPSESPGKADMIRAAESFLAHLGWQDHQCIIVCHTDRPHPHIHLAISAIHPETGRKLDDSFEQKRAQAWALGYEQSRGVVRCPQRLLPADQREPAPPRHVWELLEKGWQAHLRAETARLVESPEAGSARRSAEGFEWDILRELQKEQRLDFFEGGRGAYKKLRSEVYREVRKEFKPEWRALYAAGRDGVDRKSLAAMKADITERQSEALTRCRDEAITLLRAERDIQYRDLLDRQKEERASLLHRQEIGVGSMTALRGMAEAPVAGHQADIDQKGRAQRPEPVMPQEGSGQSNRSLWASGGAGMVSQQRAAMRWLQQVARRAENEPRVETKDNGISAAQARLYGMKRAAGAGKEQAHTKEKDGFGIEPD